jgi:hypothetical protein
LATTILVIVERKSAMTGLPATLKQAQPQVPR